MARNKLIAKYAALNTEELPQRIYDKIADYINCHGIEDLPGLELSGRWTGKLDISNGGWRNDFDLLYPVLSMCRVDRHGNVYPDMAKIKSRVNNWVTFLTTPSENDEYLEASDETFSDSGFVSDEVNEIDSADFAAEIDAFMDAGHEASDGDAVWESLDFDKSEIEKMFEEQESGPSWMEFIDDLRNGRYGDLPEDYDGLAEPEEDCDSPTEPNDGTAM